MASTTEAGLSTISAGLPAVPLTIEGSSVLHQMFRFRWMEWRKLAEKQRREISTEAADTLARLEQAVEGQSALFSMLGHKGDLMFIHFRNSFEQLKAVELQISQLRISDFFDASTSYLSMVEMGLYESSVKLFRQLQERGLEPNTPEWNAEIEETRKRQTEAMRPRLFPQIPASRYLCFYPMDRRRGEDKNWYQLPIEERQRQMEEHGLIGRRYAGVVKQIITGSIGFDDWEWGVDLFAEDPVEFKKLIYEMRFDQVSAVYALFGTFYIGVRCPAAGLADLLEGRLPGIG
ncbi:MAG TPA: hydrogen peroxide-dependent heme synthase [Candidatus Saccharimonadales bacterium]|jgi:peroxiredoxin|nr:hydrogen peroxide-dependent heme synthase [Candidatus Saccharimonadales bacterium]